MPATAVVDHKEKLPSDYSPPADDCWRHRKEYFSSLPTVSRHARFWHSRSVDSEFSNRETSLHAAKPTYRAIL
ncbi:hypothetical protein [Rhizobium laguerreae]|uniref:hypothetical protein n=1 Tax=Rhizobium laguerreae TaxID=1076926 RepID=UPI0019ECC318|nr:hypothetical protein [Rhizobium laguerreae]MBY3116588.1 hypothetical protein [Rhizobium laguerreae]MBY3207061.1 hypothetical protein [Rhizobium laguerreae]MBY3366312.1 hypothetical protein [Rhizobium laguerreae]NKN12318.1 hypothetical protein [Rhizobium laguerreae]